MIKGLNICILLVLTVWAHGQGMINDQPRMLFNNEQTVGLFLNSNGVGADFRYARMINARNDRIFEASFDYVRHPKEYKSVVAYNFYTRRFVYGKDNLFWELKGQIGNQHELFRKYDFSSISIKMHYTGGLSLGFLKPIYYEILTFDGVGQISAMEESRFDPSVHLYNYGGTASFTKGFNELKVVPGITANAGLSFEYSEREPLIHALEAGLGVTLYPSNIRIMATDEKNFFFFSLYVGYRFGNLIDVSESGRAKSWRERRNERKEAMDQVPVTMLPQLPL